METLAVDGELGLESAGFRTVVAAAGAGTTVVRIGHDGTDLPVPRRCVHQTTGER
jgi:hypothetical protein